MRDVKSEECTTNMSKLMFLMVIVGCEIDLYGFMMAWHVYWGLRQLTVRVLIITGPIGYFIATGMYMMYNQSINAVFDGPISKSSSATEQPPTDLEQSSEFRVFEGGTQNEASTTPITSQTKEPFQLCFYHFVPLFRYYLIVKELSSDDIEGVFRINSLSSFALGIAQIVGIVFYVMSEGELNLFVKINMFSQVLNWGITLLYFMTPISAYMKKTSTIEALLYNLQKRYREDYEYYIHLAHTHSPEQNAKLLAFQNNIQKEISNFCSQHLPNGAPLRLFPTFQ